MSKIEFSRGTILLFVACLVGMPHIAQAVPANEPLIITDIGGYNITYAGGKSVVFDHEDALEHQIPGYPGRKFQVAVVTLNGFLTELAFMQADKPLEVNESFDAEDYLHGRGYRGKIKSYDCSISGHNTKVVCPDIESPNLYVAVVKLGEIAKMSVAQRGNRNAFNATVALINITPCLSIHI